MAITNWSFIACALPGNAVELKDYGLVPDYLRCGPLFFFKESMPLDEPF